MALYDKHIFAACTSHSLDCFSLTLRPHSYKRCIIFSTSTCHIITCSTSVKHPPPSDNISHPSVSLNIFTCHPSFQSLFSISTSLMKKDGNCGPVNNLNQAPNNYYVSTKIPHVAKLGHRYFSIVSIASLLF